jgi:hypothetical protein
MFRVTTGSAMLDGEATMKDCRGRTQRAMSEKVMAGELSDSLLHKQQGRLAPAS